jgi:thioredoxin 1
MNSVTIQDFDRLVLQSTKPVLVDFMADWCGPCKALAPILSQLEQEQAGNVLVYSVNVDESPELMARYMVKSVPTVLAFRDGDLVGQSVGLASKPKLLGLLVG